MKNSKLLKIVLPWNLNHYLDIDGFHPRYQALLDYLPTNIQLKVWDRVALQKQFIETPSLYHSVFVMKQFQSDGDSSLQNTRSFFGYILTYAMPGDIEFHHTHLYPTMLRPFIFHCETLASLTCARFREKYKAPTGELIESEHELHQYYQYLLSSPLCLGVFSHMPETLKALRTYFADAQDIHKKLFLSDSGLSDNTSVLSNSNKSLFKPRMIFINSISQTHQDFFIRGGHLVLRFWKEFLNEQPNGTLFLRCNKPSDKDLLAYGVSLAFINYESGRSIVWLEHHLLCEELSALIANANFLLLPSMQRHNTSIMMAMALGAVPVILNIPNQVSYLNNDNSILLDYDLTEDALCHANHPRKNIVIIQKMVSRIGTMIETPNIYEATRANALRYAKNSFSGEAYSKNFWDKVTQLYNEFCQTNKNSFKPAGPLTYYELNHLDIKQIFEKPQYLMRRINTGQYAVYDFLGFFMCIETDLYNMIPSILARYLELDPASKITLGKTLQKLNGCYIQSNECGIENWTLGGYLSKILMPFPSLHHFAITQRNNGHRYYMFIRQWLKTNILGKL